MPTINISLPAKLKADAEALIAAGEYVSFSDVVRDGLRKLVRSQDTYLDQLAREAHEDVRAGRATTLRTPEDVDVFIQEMMQP